MNILNKIIGLISIGIGLILCYVEYLILTTVSAIAAWLGVFIGLTGPTTGITILLCIPILGIIIGIFALICLLYYIGVGLIMD